MDKKYMWEYFIASRVRNQHLVEELLVKLRKKKKKAYWCMETDIYHQNMSPEETMRDVESAENWRENKMVKAIFKKRLQSIKEFRKVNNAFTITSR